MTTKKETSIIAEPGKQELFITREFNAPRDMVFKAFTTPELLVQWLTPCDLKIRLEKFDSRSGGAYRYVHIDANGNEFGFHGSVHEVLTPQRIIQTFEFEGLPESGHVVLETSRFEELPGNRTRLTVQSVFQSVTDRDGMVQAGMEYGVNDSYNLLDKLLEKGTI